MILIGFSLPKDTLMKTSYLSKDTSNAIKGIALIAMFIHHLYTFPERIVSGIAHPDITTFAFFFCAPFKICVPIFAFLTGYFYGISQNRTYRYSLRKISDLLISYWIVYIPLLLLALGLGCYQFQFKEFLYELFALKCPIMTHNWYVYFYCASMLLLPVFSKISTQVPGKYMTAKMVLTVAVLTVLKALSPIWVLDQIFGSLVEFFPCIIVGFMFAEYSLFQQMDITANKLLNSELIKLILWIVMVYVAFLDRTLFPNFKLGATLFNGQWTELSFTMDIIYAPLFIYGIAHILQYAKERLLFKTLVSIGKYSLLMWFIHCLFSNACSEITQPILYAPYNPILVVLLALGFCYAIARLIHPILNQLLKLKNKLP